MSLAHSLCCDPCLDRDAIFAFHTQSPKPETCQACFKSSSAGHPLFESPLQNSEPPFAAQAGAEACFLPHPEGKPGARSVHGACASRVLIMLPAPLACMMRASRQKWPRRFICDEYWGHICQHRRSAVVQTVTAALSRQWGESMHGQAGTWHWCPTFTAPAVGPRRMHVLRPGLCYCRIGHRSMHGTSMLRTRAPLPSTAPRCVQCSQLPCWMKGNRRCVTTRSRHSARQAPCSPAGRIISCTRPAPVRRCSAPAAAGAASSCGGSCSRAPPAAQAPHPLARAAAHSSAVCHTQTKFSASRNGLPAANA